MPGTPEWYLAAQGRQEGPVPLEELVVRLRGGRIDASTLVFGPGLTEWTPIGQVTALGGQAPTPAERPASATPAQAQPVARDGGDPSHGLEQFLAETGEQDRPGDVFELESKKMLEVHVDGRTWAKLGSMIAYRGDLKFVREGAFEGGLGKFVTKMVSGEMAPLVKIEGRGIAYLADQEKNISILRLRSREAICVNGNDLLAFEASVQHQITVHRRVAGMLAGGLFSVRLTGPGMIAIMTHGEPLTLRCSPRDPVTTDPNATVAWAGHLTPDIHTDISFRSLLGRGGGEAFQLRFAGEGFVVVQPFEEIAMVAGQGRK